MGIESVSADDLKKIDAIIDRVQPKPEHRMALTLCMSACHGGPCPLRLDDMLTWPHLADISNDVYGINQHFHWGTRSLEGCFSPRFAAQ